MMMRQPTCERGKQPAESHHTSNNSLILIMLIPRSSLSTWTSPQQDYNVKPIKGENAKRKFFTHLTISKFGVLQSAARNNFSLKTSRSLFEFIHSPPASYFPKFSFSDPVRRILQIWILWMQTHFQTNILSLRELFRIQQYWCQPLLQSTLYKVSPVLPRR